MANALSRWLRRASGRLYLFNKGAYTLHSGGSSMFKIDCDALTDADLAAVAQELYVRLPAFSRVVGVPTGGLRLALALDRYVVPDAGRLLVVDDVLTTGASITAHRRVACLENTELIARTIGAAIFARGDWPAWVTPLFVIAMSRPAADVERKGNA